MIAVATATLSSHFIAFIGSLLSAHTGGLVLHQGWNWNSSRGRDSPSIAR